ETRRNDQEKADHQGRGHRGDHIFDVLPAQSGVLAAEPFTHVHGTAGRAARVDPQRQRENGAEQPEQPDAGIGDPADGLLGGRGGWLRALAAPRGREISGLVTGRRIAGCRWRAVAAGAGTVAAEGRLAAEAGLAVLWRI